MGGSAANYELGYVGGTLTINKAATTTTLSGSPASAVFGQAVTFTASVAAGGPVSVAPGGTLTFMDGGAPIAGCTARPLSAASGTATCTVAALSAGLHAITATYSGDANFAGNAAAPASLSYRVAYGFSAFSGPVDSPPTVNTASAERNIPLKSGLQNLGNGDYQFNWKTERSWAGSCRTLRLDPGDGVARTALFQFR